MRAAHALLAALFAPAMLAQTTWYVDDNAPGDPAPGNKLVGDPLEDGSAAHPFDSIQEAIGKPTTVAGHTVLVHPGTYVENIDFSGKAITIKSLAGPQATTIDGNQAANVVKFHTQETSTSVLDGFTLTRGKAPVGGGIYCYGSTPVIRNNVISMNTAVSAGGGIFCDLAHPQIDSNIIYNNNAGNSGGGIGCVSSHATITGNVINYNRAIDGAGISATNYSGVVVNNMICYNAAQTTGGGTANGGGMACSASSPTLTNNTFAFNSSPQAGGAIAIVSGSAIVMTNTIAWGNTPTQLWASQSTASVNYCDIQGGWIGLNLNVDPKFVDPDGIDDVAGTIDDNLHLQVSSQCIAAGDNGAPQLPSVDFEGNPRICPTGGLVDIGADEYCQQALIGGVVSYSQDPLIFPPKPVRSVTAELFDLQVSGTIPVLTATTSGQGQYSFAYAPASPTVVKVRVVAQTAAGSVSANLPPPFAAPVSADSVPVPVSSTSTFIQVPDFLFTSQTTPAWTHWWALDAQFEAYEWVKAQDATWSMPEVPIVVSPLVIKPLWFAPFKVIGLPVGASWLGIGQDKILFHEYAHAIMFYAYGQTDPVCSSTCPLIMDHYPYTESCPCFAFKEGWAEFVECAVSGSPEALLQTDGVCGSIQVCTTPQTFATCDANHWWWGADCNPSNNTGTVVEGAVASVFWDIFDNASYYPCGSDDEDIAWGFDGGAVSLWSAVSHMHPNSIGDLYGILAPQAAPAQRAALDAVFTTHGIPIMRVTPTVSLGASVSVTIAGQAQHVSVAIGSTALLSPPGLVFPFFEGGLLINPMPPAKVWQQGASLGASGSTTLSSPPVPVDMTLVGTPLYFQALVGTSVMLGEAAFTNTATAIIVP